MPRYVVVFAGIFVQALCSGWHVEHASLRRRTPIWRASLWFIVGVMLLWAGAADADPQHLNQLLHGDYVSTGEGTCLVALPPGFNPDLTPIDGRFTLSSSTQGIRTFNGDGTGKVATRSVAVSHPFALPTTPPFFSRGGASSSDTQADFTYEVAADRTFTTGNLAVLGTILTGPETGQTFSIANVPPFSGLMSKDFSTLTVNHDVPGVETITFSDGDVQHRICLRSRIHLKLK